MILQVWSLDQQWASPDDENYLALLNQKLWGETQEFMFFQTILVIWTHANVALEEICYYIIMFVPNCS